MIKFVCLLLAFLLAGQLFSQSITVRGKVFDEMGNPLAGATVVESGTKTGTSTSDDGSFTITVKDNSSKLSISYIGFLRQEIAVRGNADFTIHLVASNANLNDVVVIGYGTARKKDLTGAIGSLAAKDFNKGVYAAPEMLIQGKIAGVQVSSNSGLPGSPVNLKIRGYSALSGLGQPLFVVDGVPLDGRYILAGNNPLNFIDQDDIASIDVLKDASATAIYGSRAAYGVVIINTKSGIMGEPRISVGVSAGFSNRLRKIKVLDADEYIQAIPYYGASPTFDHGQSVDAQDELFQNGWQQHYSLSVSGGNEGAKYRVSGNYLNQNGFVRKSGYLKYGMDLSSQFKFLKSKRLVMDIGLIANQSVQDASFPEGGSNPVIYAALTWNPTLQLRNDDGSIFFQPNSPVSPLAVTEYWRTNSKLTTVLASISPSFKFTDWLEYKFLYSIYYGTGQSRNSANQLVSNGQGNAGINSNDQTTQQFTNTLNFHKDLSSKLNLTVLLGYEYMNFEMKGYTLAGNGPGQGFGDYGLDYTNYLQYSSTANRRIGSYSDPSTELQSFFGRAILNYQDKYMLTTTFRADGSSKFGANHKYGYFPSLAAAWVISKEKFFKSDFMNLLKLRAGWGITGNQEFPSGSAQARYSFYPNGQIVLANNPNPDLQWQSDQQLNFGVDVSLLEGRFNITADYFRKITTHLIYPAVPIQPSPPLGGTRWINLDGKIRNSGLEILLNGVLIKEKNFNWDISVNASFLENNVSDMPYAIETGWLQGGGVSGASAEVIKNGLPLQAFYTRKYLGMDKNTGTAIYEDNGNSFFYVGSPLPRALAGFSTNLSYRHFGLFLNMYGTFGQKIFNNNFLNVVNVSSIQVGGNIAQSVYHEPVKESFANPITPSSRYVVKGDFARLANLTLSYDFGYLWSGFKGGRVYLTGQNLLLITGYTGYDPEARFDINDFNNPKYFPDPNAAPNYIPSVGIDFAQYPSPRAFILGVNFTL